MDFQDDANKSFSDDSNLVGETDLSEFVESNDEQKNPEASSMRSTTESISESADRIRKSMLDQENFPGITLNVLGLDQPLTFPKQKQIIIGRLNPSTNEQPDVDLSGFPLNTTGISRKHVKIQEIDGTWYVEDLGSRNGTWLNGKLLMAYQRFQVRDGDQIRAGNITIVVLTHHVKTIENSRNILLGTELTDRIRIGSPLLSGDQKGLAPSLLSNMIMPFADALIEVMQVIDKVKKRSERAIAIHQIEFVDQIVILQFTTRHEVLKFLTQQNLETLQFDLSLDKSNATESEKISIMIAHHMMEEFVPQISPDQSLYYQHLLAQALERVIVSEFYII